MLGCESARRTIWVAARHDGYGTKILASTNPSPGYSRFLAVGFSSLILGATRTWEAESDAVAKYWSTSYSTLAVIEMQKVVDWFEAQSPASWNVPLGIMQGDLDQQLVRKTLRVLEKWE